MSSPGYLVSDQGVFPGALRVESCVCVWGEGAVLVRSSGSMRLVE